MIEQRTEHPPGSDTRPGPAGPVRRRWPPRGAPRRRLRPLPLLFGTAWLFVAVYPIYYMLAASFRTPAEFLDAGPWSVPTSPTLENYRSVVDDGIGMYFINSAFVTVTTVALITFVSLLAAYAITRAANSAILFVFNVFLLGLAVPYQAAIIPIYVIITGTGMYDTLFGLIPPQVAFGIPITVLILVNFIRDIPNELYQSMALDGAGHVRLLKDLVFPLSRPALVTVVIYNGLQVWNNFLFPLILTQSTNVRTIPLALREFQGQYGVNVPGIMAAVILSALPIVFLYIVARRQLLGGLTAGFSR